MHTLPIKKESLTTLRRFLCGGVLGACVFLLLYGTATLNVTYDSWILRGYVEEDIIQHYTAWQFLRNAPWQLPLCWLPTAAQPTGASAAFADVLPLAGVFFKVLSPILPATFQYFGIVSLVNYILQGGFAAVLVAYFDTRCGVWLPGALLLTAWPVLIERTYRHMALSCQWVLLWAIWLYFVTRRENRLPWFSFVVLFAIVPTLHAYFLPGVAAMLCAAMLEYMLRNKTFWRPVFLMAACLAITFVSARGFGVIMPHMRTDGDGYGGYSMNLNALWNPTSMDLYAEDDAMHWSRLLPVLGQTRHQYDGFNYLGFGVLAALACMAVYGLHLLVKKPAARGRLAASLKSHIGVIIATVVLFMFAVSNVVYLNDTHLFTIPLPKALILYVFATFRASGRVFWVVGYLMALGVVVFCARHFRGKKAVAALCLVLALQLGDMGGVLAQKATYFRSGTLTAETGYQSEKWQQVMQGTDTVLCLGNMFDYRLAQGIIAQSPKVQTDLIFFARGNFGMVYLQYEENRRTLGSGQPIPDNVLYVASEESACLDLLRSADENVGAWKIEGFYFLGNTTAARPAPDYT